MRRKILGGSIAVVVISIVTIQLTTSIDDSDMLNENIETMTSDPLIITDFFAKYDGDDAIFYLSTDRTIPKDPLNDYLGFGYFWFGTSSSSDHFISGPGHLEGYLALYKNEDSRWSFNKVSFFQTVNDDNIFCLEKILEYPAKVEIVDNKLSVTTKLFFDDLSPYRLNKVGTVKYLDIDGCSDLPTFYFVNIKYN